MRRYIVMLIIIGWFINLSSAVTFSENDVEWASASSATLYKGNTLTNGEYMVKAVQFPSPVPGIKDINGNIVPEDPVEPSVLLELYKNGSLVKQFILTLLSDTYIDSDYEVKVTATGFTAKNAREWVFEYYNPSASISLQKRGLPKIEITITTDKTEYISYDDQIITAKVEVKNNGDAFAKNIDVNLNIGELKLRGGDISQLHRYYYRIDKSKTESFEIILVVPELIDQKISTLGSDAVYYDLKELKYNSKSSLAVTISPRQNYVTVSKAVRDRIYLRDTAMVRITVANGGMFNAYGIKLNDSMNENFDLLTNTPLQWEIPVLKPGEEWGTSYSIKPLEANLNGFVVPAAYAEFTVNNKLYNISSKTTTVVVNGPKIMLNKTVNKSVVNISEDFTVTVSLNNIGNIATRVEVKDSLPENLSLVSGSTSLPSTFLELKAPQGFSYIVRVDQEGIVELPQAVANYTEVEYRGTTRSVLSSERPVITVVDPSKITPTPTPTATIPDSGTEQTPMQEIPGTTNSSSRLTPGFELMFAIIVLIFVACRRR